MLLSVSSEAADSVLECAWSRPEVKRKRSYMLGCLFRVGLWAGQAGRSHLQERSDLIVSIYDVPHTALGRGNREGEDRRKKDKFSSVNPYSGLKILLGLHIIILSLFVCFCCFLFLRKRT